MAGYTFSHKKVTDTDEVVISPLKAGDKIGAFYNIWDVVSNTPNHMIATMSKEIDCVMTVTQFSSANPRMYRTILDLNTNEVTEIKDYNAIELLSMPDDMTFKRFLVTDEGLSIEHVKTIHTTNVIPLVIGDTIQGKINGNAVVGTVAGVSDTHLWVFVESAKLMFVTEPAQLSEHNITHLVSVSDDTLFVPTDEIIVEDIDPVPPQSEALQ